MPTKCVCDKYGQVLSIKTNINSITTPPTKTSNYNKKSNTKSTLNIATIKDAMIQHNKEEKEYNDKSSIKSKNVNSNNNVNVVVDLLCIVLSKHTKRIMSSNKNTMRECEEVENIFLQMHVSM